MTTVFRPTSGVLLRSRLADIVHRVLSGRDGFPDVSRGQCAALTFAALGVDSLAGAELTLEIEEELGIALSPSDVFAYPDVESLAGFIERRETGESSYSAEPPAASQRHRLARMLEDAILPEDIRPVGRSMGPSILVTGATGFVGAHLVRELLRDPSARVCCLVRARGGGVRGAAARVRSALERYATWDSSYESRLEVIVGDLARASLGLDESAFADLAESTGEIFHAAADVDWIQPYDALRDANVIGTRELLRLACTGAAKPFHFISSLGVCYGTDWTNAGSETDEPLDGLGGLHLGYAQSKCVAEALVREAGHRGLRVTIVRPALVSGDSRSGVSNADDLISLFIRGCIRMGAAPDLDWAMDSVPADHVAEATVRLARAEAESSERVYHLANPSPRHWRECVLWMRLRGYPLELLPYRAWTNRLRVEAAATGHPLHPLRSFFLGTVDGQAGLSLPELYEEHRRRPVSSVATKRALQETGVLCPRLDAQLLERYFASYVELGVIPPACHHERSEGSAHRANGSSLATLTEGRSLSDVKRMGSDDSIVAELTSWRRGTAAGLYSARLSHEANGAGASMDAVIKVKPRDSDVIEIGSHVAHLCRASLGAAYDKWQEHVGFTRGHLRELAVYENAPVRARPHMPRLHATASRPDAGEWMLAIERVTDAVVINASDRPWTNDEIDAALRGLARVHAAWLEQRTAWSNATWLPPARTTAVMTGMRPLWSELAANARPMFDEWAGRELGIAHRRLVASVGEWWPASLEQPRTLIHNDFNPRNVLLRRVGGGLELCAFDWELATVGAPQRDIAEFLCFALDPELAGEQVGGWIERARTLFSEAASLQIDRDTWAAGFRAALGEFLIDRVAMYAMLHRIRPQPFLPRVARAWLSIHNRVEASR